MSPTPPDKEKTDDAYWRSVIRLTLGLLAVWALVSIVASILFVEPMNRMHVGRLPAGFWMAQQGSIVVFVVIIWIYARRMDRIDRTFNHKKDGRTNSSNGGPTK